MKIANSAVYLEELNYEQILKRLERYGRVCYKSEDKFKCYNDNHSFLKMLVDKNHESVLEHEKMTFLMVLDRGVSHELVRHRMASYSQESTRYCNYAKDSFGNELTFIKPIFFAEKSEMMEVWKKQMKNIEKNYFKLLELGAKPEQARSILPNSLKTEIVVSMNFRSLRNYFKLRCSKSAHPQIKEVSIPLLIHLQEKLEPIFGDIEYDKDFSKENYANLVFTDGFFEER